MDFDSVLMVITMAISLVLGYISKKSKFISNNLIPIQNILVGLIMTIIEWIIKKDFSIAVLLSGVAAGGTYDIVHNIKKLKRGEADD